MIIVVNVGININNIYYLVNLTKLCSVPIVAVVLSLVPNSKLFVASGSKLCLNLLVLCQIPIVVCCSPPSLPPWPCLSFLFTAMGLETSLQGLAHSVVAVLASYC